MKNKKYGVIGAGIIALAISAFTHTQSNAIKGTVTPADKATKAWALSSSDTLSAPVVDGSFQIQNVKAGDYSVIIEAQAPYANTRRKDVVVTDGQITDVGEIKLQQK